MHYFGKFEVSRFLWGINLIVGKVNSKIFNIDKQKKMQLSLTIHRMLQVRKRFCL